MKPPHVRTIREGVPPGFVAVYPPGQVAGARPNGTRVAKINSVEGDGHQDGALGTVVASHLAPEDGIVLYFVVWDDLPTMSVCVAEDRVRTV